MLVSLVIEAKKMYNISVKYTSKLLVLPILFSVVLTGCGAKEETPSGAVETHADEALVLLANFGGVPTVQTLRSAPLGTLLLYAWNMLPPETYLPLRGIIAQMKLLSGEVTVDSEETFLLLQEFGGILQVDVVEILNQSEDRPSTLNIYVNTLENITERATMMLAELEAEKEALEEQRKTERETVRDQENEIEDALENKDFNLAGTLQPALLEAQKKLSETETNLDQTDAIIDIYEDLIEVGEKRLIAIDENRGILIAGLRVVEVPGIEDIGVLEEAERLRGLGSPF